MAAVILAACKYPDPGGLDALVDFDAPIDADLENGAYVVAHTTLDGTETTVAVVRSLDVYGELDLTGARMFGAGTRVFVAGGKVFVATDRTVRRFGVVDYSLVEEPPLVSFTSTNVMMFDDSFAVLNDQHVWYFERSRAEVYAMNVDTMTVSTPIYYATIEFTDHFVVPTGMVKVGDIVYMPYYFVRAGSPTFIESEMYIAQFAFEGQQLITMDAMMSLRSGRCARSHLFARLADDTLLILGDSGSLYDIATPQISPNCLVQVVQTMPNEIDFNFYSNMDALTSPRASATRPKQFGNRVITWARDASRFDTQAEWDAGTRWTPQTTDLDNSLITEQLTDEVATVGTPGDTFFIDGRPYLLVPKTSGTGTSLVTANAGGTYEERTNFPGRVTLIERVR
ncbi:MAG: hypothetical protein ACKV2T_03705 [Kofleriaceae bacterium]